jgi:hypothetical protein
MKTPTSIECDHPAIKAVEEAFDAAWAIIQTNEPDRDVRYDCERMTALSQKLAALVLDGVTDPAELRDLALAAWPLWHEPAEALAS